MNTISVIGLGYIGLPTAAIFASRKRKVIGVDTNRNVVETINRGEIHIVEPDLDIVVRACVTDGYLRAVVMPEPADAFLIAVPTPFTEDHKPDLSYIEAASKLIAPVLQRGNLVILESTSPVGATLQMAKWLAAARPDLTFPHTHAEDSDICVAHCPERVLPGNVMRELVQNDRVIGGLTPKCSEAAVALYKIFVRGECVVTNARTAEMAKLTENSFRDVNIGFANELSLICDAEGIDVWELIQLANRHPRVNILQPGPGVGGHCIAVDPWFIIDANPDLARIIRAARDVNDAKPRWVVDKVKAAVEELFAERNDYIRVFCLGLAFKPNIDDLRESPALHITQAIADLDNVELGIFEPNIEQLPAVLEGKGVLLSDLRDIKNADIVVILVDHKEFLGQAKTLPPGAVLIDTKGIWGGRDE